MLKTILTFGLVAFFILLLTPIGTVLALSYLVGLSGPMSRVMQKVGVIWASIIIKIAGITVKASGMENIPKDRGMCFVSNHASILDIVLILRYAGRPFGFIAKKELLLIPLLNLWVLLLGGLFINRKSPRKALKTINLGVAKIKKGGAMIIFPEGHRSRGKGLLPFHAGSLKLATLSNSVIVPVAIKGTWEIFEKSYRVVPGPVEITFCDPIDTENIAEADRKIVLSGQIFDVISGVLQGKNEG